MTIHGVGYRPLDYQPTSAPARLWPIAVLEFRALFRSRWGILLFGLCQAPALGSLSLMLLRAGVWQLGDEAPREMQMGGPRADPHSPHFYLDPVVVESFVLFLALTTLVSCRAVAKDRAAHALEIYWTRGIGPWGYFLAKWFGSFLLIGVGFVGAPLLLWVLGVLMAPDWGMLDTTIRFMPRVSMGLVLFTLGLTGIATGFSALTSNPNFSSILWVFLLVGSAAVGRLLSRLFRGEFWLKAISPWDAMKRLTEWVAGVTPRQDYSPMVALLSVGCLCCLLALCLTRRLRLSEAVA